MFSDSVLKVFKFKLPLNIYVTMVPNNATDLVFHYVCVAYTMAKYGMSMCVLGMAEEFRGSIAVNALWPKTGNGFHSSVIK